MVLFGRMLTGSNDLHDPLRPTILRIETDQTAQTVKRYLPWFVATVLFMEWLDFTIVNTAVP
jgi:hypothetical protein